MKEINPLSEWPSEHIKRTYFSEHLRHCANLTSNIVVRHPWVSNSYMRVLPEHIAIIGKIFLCIDELIKQEVIDLPKNEILYLYNFQFDISLDHIGLTFLKCNKDYRDKPFKEIQGSPFILFYEIATNTIVNDAAAYKYSLQIEPEDSRLSDEDIEEEVRQIGIPTVYKTVNLSQHLPLSYLVVNFNFFYEGFERKLLEGQYDNYSQLCMQGAKFDSCYDAVSHLFDLEKNNLLNLGCAILCFQYHKNNLNTVKISDAFEVIVPSKKFNPALQKNMLVKSGSCNTLDKLTITNNSPTLTTLHNTL